MMISPAFSIAGHRHAIVLTFVAPYHLVQEETGRREHAVAVSGGAGGRGCDRRYLEARQRAGTTDLWPPISPPKPRLIAETAQQAARIAQSMAGEQSRASALVAIANALPN